jgi:hypothetical protein
MSLIIGSEVEKVFALHCRCFLPDKENRALLNQDMNLAHAKAQSRKE